LQAAGEAMRCGLQVGLTSFGVASCGLPVELETGEGIIIDAERKIPGLPANGYLQYFSREDAKTRK